MRLSKLLAVLDSLGGLRRGDHSLLSTWCRALWVPGGNPGKASLSSVLCQCFHVMGKKAAGLSWTAEATRRVMKSVNFSSSAWNQAMLSFSVS